jgi:hypothetical protein
MGRYLTESLRRSEAWNELSAQPGARADAGRNGEVGAFMLCLHNSPSRGTQPVTFRFQQFMKNNLTVAPDHTVAHHRTWRTAHRHHQYPDHRIAELVWEAAQCC